MGVYDLAKHPTCILKCHKKEFLEKKLLDLLLYASLCDNLTVKNTNFKFVF